MKKSTIKKIDFGWSMLFFFIFLAIMSCDSDSPDDVIPDDDEPKSGILGCQYPTSTSIGSYTLEQGSFFVVNNAPTVYQAFGFSFNVAFDGSIKGLGVKLPEARDYTVRIYNEDPAINDILAETSITTTNDDWVYVSIDPLSIDKDQTYMACVYVKSKPEGLESFFFHIPNFAYPAVDGDVTIKNTVYEAGNDKIKPVPNTGSTILNGFVDFCFEAD